MKQRSQQTISRAVEVTGIGFLTGADVRLRFLPAPPNHGIAFLRTDCSNALPIPALVDFVVPRQRRTAIEWRGVTVEMTEHVLAALYGLRIDNCLVTLDAPEPPGCDGSCLAFAEGLWDAGIVEQGALRRTLVIQHDVCARSEDRSQWIKAAAPVHAGGGLTVGYSLEYGVASPIESQRSGVELTPESFLKEIAFARTFVLEEEATYLRAQGYGRRTTARDLLIFGKQGPIDNAVRAPDECARHKILDCIGDLALIGCDVHGTIDAFRSGHRLNAELVRRLKLAHAEDLLPPMAQNAA